MQNGKLIWHVACDESGVDGRYIMVLVLEKNKWN